MIVQSNRHMASVTGGGRRALRALSVGFRKDEIERGCRIARTSRGPRVIQS